MKNNWREDVLISIRKVLQQAAPHRAKLTSLEVSGSLMLTIRAPEKVCLWVGVRLWCPSFLTTHPVDLTKTIIGQRVVS